MNLAGHLIDLVLTLTGAPVTAVSALTSRKLYDTPVEDFAAITMQSATDTIAILEAGYTFADGPDEGREVAMTLASPRNYLRLRDGVVQVRARDGSASTHSVEVDTDPLYGVFVARALEDVRTGRATLPGLTEAAAAMAVLEAAYRSAAEGGVRVGVDAPDR